MFFFDTKQAQIFYLHNLEVSGLNILLSTVAPGAWSKAKLSPNHILKKAFATRQHAFHSRFYDISVRTCAKFKISRTRQECDTYLGLWYFFACPLSFLCSSGLSSSPKISEKAPS